MRLSVKLHETRGFLMLLYRDDPLPTVPCNNITRKDLYDFYYTLVTLTTGYKGLLYCMCSSCSWHTVYGVNILSMMNNACHGNTLLHMHIVVFIVSVTPDSRWWTASGTGTGAAQLTHCKYKLYRLTFVHSPIIWWIIHLPLFINRTSCFVPTSL